MHKVSSHHKQTKIYFNLLIQTQKKPHNETCVMWLYCLHIIIYCTITPYFLAESLFLMLASYASTVAATPTFKESTLPNIGMEIITIS